MIIEWTTYPVHDRAGRLLGHLTVLHPSDGEIVHKVWGEPGRTECRSRFDPVRRCYVVDEGFPLGRLPTFEAARRQ